MRQSQAAPGIFGLRHARVFGAAPLAVALLLGAATSASGDEPPAKPAQAAADPAAKPAKPAKPPKAAKPKEKLICTTRVVTGSLMPERVCKTQEQIDADRQLVEDLQSQRQGSGAALIGDRP